MNPETALQNEIRLACSRGPTRLYRCQTGAFPLADGRQVRAGFRGAPDLWGWTTENYDTGGVNVDIARFVCIEVKTGRGKLTAEQFAFLKFVHAAGGYAGVARSVEDARRIIAGEHIGL